MRRSSIWRTRHEAHDLPRRRRDMAMSSSRNIEREALAWLGRINDPEFEAWDAWEAWIAMDPRHAITYWRLAAAEADVVAALAARSPTRRGNRRRPKIRWA